MLAAPFLLLNRFSLPVTLAIIAGLNFGVAAVLWRWARRGQASSGLGEFRRHGRGLTPRPGAAAPSGVRVPLWALAFGSGFVSLAFEVSLIRALFVLNPSSPYNFPAALIPFLLALAASSALFTRAGADEPARALRRVGWLFVASVVAMLIVVTASAMLSLGGVRPLALEAPAGDAAFLLHAVLLGTRCRVPRRRVPVAAAAGRSDRRGPARPGRPALSRQLGRCLRGRAPDRSSSAFRPWGRAGSSSRCSGSGWRGARVSVARRARGRARARLASPRAGGTRRGPAGAAGVVWRVYASGFPAVSVERLEGVTGVAAIDWHPAGGDVFVNGQFMSHLPDHPRHVRLVSFALALPRRDTLLLLGLGGGGMVRELAKDPGTRRLEVVDWSYELPRLLDGPRARHCSTTPSGDLT